MATWPAKTNYATGDVLTAAQMQDIGNALNSLESAQYAAGKNKIINGDFNINQRGTTSTTTSGTFLVDRTYFINIGGTCTASVQSFTLGTAPISGYEAKQFLRLVTSGQSGAGDLTILQQQIESVRTFAGETVTISFWAKAASGTPKITAELSQLFGTGGSPSSDVNTTAGTATISTSWQRYSFTVAVPSISGKTLGTNNNDCLTLRLWVSAGSNFNARTNSMGLQAATFDFWGVQVESGSTATAFQTATGTLAGELALAQRYYEVTDHIITASTTAGGYYAAGYWKVSKRATPTITISVRSTGSGGSVTASSYNPTSAFWMGTYATAVANAAIIGESEL